VVVRERDNKSTENLAEACVHSSVVGLVEEGLSSVHLLAE